MLNSFFTKSLKKDYDAFDGILNELKNNLVEYPVVKNNKDRLQYLINVLKSPAKLNVWLRYILKNKKVKFKTLYDICYYSELEENQIIHVQFNTSLDDLKDLTKLGLFKNLKVIVTFHGYDAFRLSPNLYLREYEWFYRHHVNFITVNSNYLKNHLINVGVSDEKIKIIPVGININQNLANFKKRRERNNTLKLISVGRLIQLKGHEYGIKAVADLKNRGIEVEYIIVGSGLASYEDYLKSLITKLGCESEIRMLGHKNQKEITALFSNNDIFLMPSTYDNNTFRREALGLAAIEAQAYGLPVVGFNTGGLNEAVSNGKSGILVEDRNVNALVLAILKLFNDKSVYQNFSENARKYVFENFENAVIFEKYTKLYKACYDS
ncbi:glycosyltransferase family 4 protein [Mesonia sp. HuA40]|uniref:glycosyltransferase family 4 protein n=1 Tax=Mesonia sp. HuA40 TaxID=2602761 RepID=UPI0016502D7B|nr:glycosyltransferase family 4 protein [Mesonia sp. HuA40]